MIEQKTEVQGSEIDQENKSEPLRIEHIDEQETIWAATKNSRTFLSLMYSKLFPVIVTYSVPSRFAAALKIMYQYVNRAQADIAVAVATAAADYTAATAVFV